MDKTVAVSKIDLNKINLDEIDRKIIAATDKGLSVTISPFSDLAQELNLPLEMVLLRVSKMQNLGVIRRIAAVPNHYSLGYKFNAMTVWDVEDEMISDLGRRVGALEFVSHCYRRPRLRDWDFNLFAMIHAKSQEEIEKKIEQIKLLLSSHFREHKVLLSCRVLKKTGFRVKKEV